MGLPVVVEAAGSRATFDGQQVVIERLSAMVRKTFGDAVNVIPLAQITSAQLRQPSWHTIGHIRFTVAGSQAGAVPLRPNQDPNAVLFSKRQRKEAGEFYAAVQEALRARPVG